MLLSVSVTLSQTVNPEILWATYFGSPGNDFTGCVATDNDENIYMSSTVKSGAPTTEGVHQRAYGGGLSDVMLTKFDKNGNLIWSTYFGGSGNDANYFPMSLMSDGAIVITGNTTSTNKIATTDAHHSSFGGGSSDAFIAVFENNGTLRWATYFGGSGTDSDPAVTIDQSDNIYLVGYTGSLSEIATDSAFQSTKKESEDAFLAKFDKTGKLIWSTYYGGQGYDAFYGVTTDQDYNVYVGGESNSSQLATTGSFKSNYGGNGDGFLAKFDKDGKRIWATYFGSGGTDGIYYLASDQKNNIYCIGPTTSTEGIASTGAYATMHSGKEDVFIAKFNAKGDRLWSTYIGGDEWDSVFGCDFDDDDNVYLAIMTKSQNFPLTADVPMPYFGGGPWDAAFVKFSSAGELKWSTYFGGDGNDRAISLALDKSQNIVASINADSKGLATPGAYDEIANGNESLLIKFRDATIVDIKEIALMAELQIFPNPTSTYFEIPNNRDEIRNISIYNASGEMVRSHIYTKKENFDISDLVAGLYYVVINTKGISAATKLIKIH